MENFINSVVLPENLPEIEKKSFNLLDKKYLKILYIRITIFFLIFAGSFTALILFPGNKLPAEIIIIIGCTIVVITAYSTVITILGFSKKGYLVREKDISYQKGLITYKLTSVPFNRIQHVEVNQGVLAKIFKLSSVKIYTAGGNASDLSIPGLPVAIAQNLKAFLSEKISEHE
jgi:membrane protein YdbS with pleckstrin-like domain